MLSSRASQGHCKDKKTLKYKKTFCSFLQITEVSHISTNIIDKNVRNIDKLIHMSFFYIGYDIFPNIALRTT